MLRAALVICAVAFAAALPATAAAAADPANAYTWTEAYIPTADPTMLQTISTAFHRGGWGMWPILCTSIVTIAVIVERAVYLFKASVDKDKLLALLKSQVMAGNVQGAIKVCSGNPTPMTRIVQAGLMKFNKSDEEVQAAMDEAALSELPKINTRTPYIAMLSNFAVMAGLLVNISGMIKSFG